MSTKAPLARNEIKPPPLPDARRPSFPSVEILEGTPQPSPQRQRRRMLVWALALCVGFPTLAAAIYYGLVASDQYVVEVRFAIRGSSAAPSTDLLGIFSGGTGSNSTVADSYIVIDYVRSRELVDKLDERIGLKQIYSRPDADYFSRFDPNLSAEEFVEYWRSMLRASFDSASQVVSIEVRAFTAEDARTVATALLERSEQLINELSARARDDAVKSARLEVTRMEDRLRTHRTALRSFRDTKQEFDPTKQAESRYSILAKLEEELSRSKTRLANLRSFMGKDAPSVMVLNSEIGALERQVLEQRAKLGSTESITRETESLGGLVANYEELVVEREFAEKAYLSALSSLERARFDADRQQRYVAAFVRPTLPQEPLYPKRILATFAVFAISLLLWALGLLLVYAVRDHAL